MVALLVVILVHYRIGVLVFFFLSLASIRRIPSLGLLCIIQRWQFMYAELFAASPLLFFFLLLL